jgi:hypothetical protein
MVAAAVVDRDRKASGERVEVVVAHVREPSRASIAGR